jgi:cytochrome c-type biogenesis protein CcmH
MTWRSLLRQRSIQIALAVLVAVLAVWIVTFAVSARPRSVEQRTHDIASQLRCPVCNGESVADSSTPIAQQMRSVIRQDVQAGQSDDQIIAAFRASYGDSILLRPPFDGFTAIIWFGPIVALLVGIAIITLAARAWRQAQPAPAPAIALDDEAARDLSPDERARLMAVLRRELAEDEGLRYTSGKSGKERS